MEEEESQKKKQNRKGGILRLKKLSQQKHVHSKRNIIKQRTVLF